MATAPQPRHAMHSVVFLVFRRLRAPLILLIVIYAVSVLGLGMIPGVDAEGRPTAPMSLFHAFYFVSFTATTIGFGELPVPFGNAQRMWALVTIYLQVFGWTYVLVTLLALAQDRAFRHALATARFQRQVRLLSEPFYLICGCGETGRLLVHALDSFGMRCVVVERSDDRINELDLDDLHYDVPALTGDASMPQVLELAGLTHPFCRGVLALTNDDAANLAVSASVRMLDPDVQVIARAQSPMTAANMASFGTRHVINPFEKFADYLRLAMREPNCYRLLEWLIALPGTRLRAERAPPRGNWIVCGHGRFGSAVTERLADEGMQVRIIDPDPAVSAGDHVITGVGTEAAVLEAAGIKQAEGIVAGTDNDIRNLAIAVTAREINPEIFLAFRQNLIGNRRIVEGVEPDLVMVASEIVAHECLGILTAPLLGRFLRVVRTAKDEWASELIERLKACVGEHAPELWSIRIDRSNAPALFRRLSEAKARTTLADIMRNPLDRERMLNCVPMLLVRADGTEVELPQPGEELKAMHALLFAGTAAARTRLELTVRNSNELDHVCTGADLHGGWVWRMIARMLRGKAEPSGTTESSGNTEKSGSTPADAAAPPPPAPKSSG